MTPIKQAKPAVCVNCGKTMAEHIAVNYSNGNLIFADVYICPTAVFRRKPKARAKTWGVA